MNAMNIHTGTFSFNDGDKSICSNKCKGDETDAIKTDVLANMIAYMRKHEDQNWRTNAKHFLVQGSPAAMLLEASETFEMFKTDFKVLSSVSKTGCTSVFGNLVKAISLPSSPLALSALIWTKQNESKVLLEQALGSEYVRNNNEVIDNVLRVIAKDEMCSLIYPATSYNDAKPLDRATRGEIALFYQNHSNNARLQMSAINGQFQHRWINDKTDRGERLEIKSKNEVSISSNSSSHNNNKNVNNNKKRTFDKSFNSSKSNNNNNNNSNNKNAKSNIICDFCKTPGHKTKNCFKRKKSERNNNDKKSNSKN